MVNTIENIHRRIELCETITKNMAGWAKHIEIIKSQLPMYDINAIPVEVKEAIDKQDAKLEQLLNILTS